MVPTYSTTVIVSFVFLLKLLSHWLIHVQNIPIYIEPRTVLLVQVPTIWYRMGTILVPIYLPTYLTYCTRVPYLTFWTLPTQVPTFTHTPRYLGNSFGFKKSLLPDSSGRNLGKFQGFKPDKMRQYERVIPVGPCICMKDEKISNF